MSSHDHSPAMADLRWSTSAWHELPRRRQPVCDAKAVSDPEARQAFEQSLMAFLPLPCGTSLHDQTAHANAFVRKAAASAFPLVQVPIQSYISKATFELIQARRPRRASALLYRARAKRELLRIFWAAWRSFLGIARCPSSQGASGLVGFLRERRAQQRIDACLSQRYLDETLRSCKPSCKLTNNSSDLRSRSSLLKLAA